jgi:hypothetical protein
MKYEMQEVTDYWCPSDERWGFCPGPCPDGRAHIAKKTVKRVQVLTMEEARAKFSA